MTTRVRVLTANAFDFFEFTSLVQGGVGRGVGHCIHYLAGAYADLATCEPTHALFGADIGGAENDRAVERINRRKGHPRDRYVTFDEWCAELNVVRGDQ